MSPKAKRKRNPAGGDKDGFVGGFDFLDVFGEDEITAPSAPTTRDRTIMSLGDLQRGSVFLIGKTSWQVEHTTGGTVYAIKAGTKGRKLYWIRLAPDPRHVEAVEINPGNGNLVSSVPVASGELHT